MFNLSCSTVVKQALHKMNTTINWVIPHKYSGHKLHSSLFQINAVKCFPLLVEAQK